MLWLAGPGSAMRTGRVWTEQLRAGGPEAPAPAIGEARNVPSATAVRMIKDRACIDLRFLPSRPRPAVMSSLSMASYRPLAMRGSSASGPSGRVTVGTTVFCDRGPSPDGEKQAAGGKRRGRPAGKRAGGPAGEDR